MSQAADEAPRGRDVRVIALIGTGHFLSHFYILVLPPLFLAWREEFGVSFAALGAAVAAMSAVTAILQTPVGFLVDRYGARGFLVGGNLLMALSISAMAFAPSYEWILLFSVLSGVGNSVIHPADYAILAGSIHKSRMGRAFAWHTMTGNLGFALAPPVVAAMLLVMGWREALFILGLLGVPVVGAILWQSRILSDQPKAKPREAGALTGRRLLLSRPILLFFGFFLLSAMAGTATQAFLIPVLGLLWGVPLAIASMALTGYMAGATGGTLIGGWYVDRYRRHLAFVAVLSLFSAGCMLLLGAAPLGPVFTVVVPFLAGLALGASRTPRDVMLKDASPPGEVGKVFGFVSSGLPLGGAITPIPFGFLLDMGLPWLLLPVIAALILASLACAGWAQAEAQAQAQRPAPRAVPAE
ncbi:MAG: MFS transporter [Acetobacteraceae bacterium]|nr:MFS transporter [Acetobacteraceae bacterium]MDW8399487.1 MFS transporter [Acetobacteraceae bacterium]